jgi:hypothetical protein
VTITRHYPAISPGIPNHRSCRWDPIDLVRFALMNLSVQLNAKNPKGRPKDLKFSFLFSATVFLLALRYRKKDPRFLEPPAKGEKANPIFSEALRILEHA